MLAVGPNFIDYLLIFEKGLDSSSFAIVYAIEVAYDFKS